MKDWREKVQTGSLIFFGKNIFGILVILMINIILYETNLYLHFVDVSEKDVATSSENCPRKRVKSIIKVKIIIW